MIRIENADMSEYTSFKAGGKADLLLIPDNAVELSEALKEAKDITEKTDGKNGIMILGNGSDTLVKDGGYRGTVIKLGEGFSEITVDGNVLTAGSAALLSQASKVAAQNSLSGLECESGIPGSIGGAVTMNAGAYGGEMKDILESVKVIDPEGMMHTLSVEALDLSYRHSCIMEKGGIVVEATIKLEKKPEEEIRAQMADLRNRRVEKQPLEYPSAGSTFKRPAGNYASKLIDECGLRGYTVGGAQVSEKHAGFVINRGGATFADVMAVCDHVRETVRVQTGYVLELEPEILRAEE